MKTFVILLLFMLLAIVLVATNPTMTEFDAFVKENFKNELPAPEQTNWIYETIRNVFARQTEASNTIETMTRYKNYYVFSTYEINLPTTELTYIGVADRFFLLQKSENTAPAE